MVNSLLYLSHLPPSNSHACGMRTVRSCMWDARPAHTQLLTRSSLRSRLIMYAVASTAFDVVIISGYKNSFDHMRYVLSAK